MEKGLFNISLFIGALMLAVGIFKNSLLLTAMALILAIVAQHLYHKKISQTKSKFQRTISRTEK